MNCLDFLSKSPNTLIFGQKSSKTNLGGVLTVIYLIIVLIIAVAYLFDYGVNNKYSVLYVSEHGIISTEEGIERFFDEKLNPIISFKINFSTNANINNFLLAKYNLINQDISVNDLGKEYRDIPLNFYYIILYKCPNNYTNCTLRKEDNPEGSKYFITVLNYTGVKIDHQNEIPLQKNYAQETITFGFGDKITLNMLKWKTIIYEEEKGLFGTFEKNILGKSNKLYGGELMNYQTLSIDRPEGFDEIEKQYNAKILSMFIVTNTKEKITDTYTRKKKGIFDPISLICSLSLTVYNGFIFAFCTLYSKNFDNYKVIESILSKNRKPLLKKKIKEEKAIELSSDFDKKENLIDTEDNNILEPTEKEKEDDNENNEENERCLPKLNFYDYIFNNIYCKNRCLSNKQEIVRLCNEIISKYYTMDFIIYNQMKLENLFKDYKWNNPELNTIENNKMISDLKLLI